jgi:hypothetical protein
MLHIRGEVQEKDGATNKSGNEVVNPKEKGVAASLGNIKNRSRGNKWHAPHH